VVGHDENPEAAAAGSGEHGAHVVEQADAFRHFLCPGPELAPFGQEVVVGVDDQKSGFIR